MRLFLRAGMSVAIFSALACTDIDTTRNPAPRGTIGEEVYGAFCDRVAAQVFPEDLTGDSYRDVCHKDNGQYADAVDTSQLPPITSDGVDINGNPVSAQTQAAARAYATNRVGALARRRPDLIAALDATIPDVLVPVKDTHNPVAAQSCGVPAMDQISLGKALADMLGRFGPLVDDGTMPRSTESLATLMQSIQGSTEAQAALVRLASRIGYRPVLTTLGAARPSMSYDQIRDLANSTLGLISPDSKPYDLSAPRDALGNRVPEPGPANGQLNQVVATAQQELRTATIDPTPAPLKITADPFNGRQLLSRPRTNLEALGVVMMDEDPNFGAGASRYIVRRDSRGFATVPLVANKLPAPFVDNDSDGLPDVDPSTGLFVSSSGTAPPSPFFSVDALTQAAAYDPFDRSLVGNALVYGYIDTTHTFSASMLTDVQALVNPDITQKHESLMYMLGGAYVMLGTRDGSPSSQRAYGAGADQVTISYDAYHPENSPFVDLVYAIGQILGDSSTDDVLVLTKSLMQNHQNDLARLVGAMLAFKDVGNKHPEAVTPPKSTFWDEILDVMVQVEQEPGLLEDVLRSTESPQSGLLGGVFANYMQFKDHMTYDRKNLNGPVFDVDTNDNSEMSQAVDRTKPDEGANRSAFMKFVQLVHDTNGVTACNKEGAVLHAKGVPLLGSADMCSGFPYLCSGGASPFHECEVFKIDNLAKFYVQSIVGKAQLYLRPDYLRNGVVGIGAATVDMMQQSSGIIGFWDATGSHTLRPKPQFLSRQVYFDIDNDSPTSSGQNYTTNHFLNDLMGNHTVGTVACPENLIPDPVPGAPDASPDGYVHGLRQCASGDSVDKKDPDALFVLENFGAFDAFAPMIQAFANHNREDLYLALMETIYRHWADAKDDKSNCDPSGSTKTNPDYCTQDGLVSYEPLLAEAFPGDILPALAAVTIDTDTTSVAHCTAANSTGTCTAETPLGGVSVLANVTRALLDPKTAKAIGLLDHHGKATALRNDGTTNPQVTPIYLLTEALNEIDAAFGAFPQTDPSDADRQANWRLGRSQLVDQFLAIKGTGAASTFGDVSIPTVTPTLVDMLRSQMNANCPLGYVPPYNRCNWARDDLTNKISDSIKGPFFSTTMDLLDAIRRDDASRSALESLLQYLANAASQNDALASLLATTDDLLQVMNDDQNLVPVYHALSGALTPTQRDATGHILSASVVDSQLTLLSHVAGKFFDGTTEICADEADPNQILPQILTRLVTPMKDTTGHLTQTPLEVILDVIADVNRTDPSQTNKLASGDYGAIAGQVNDFLMNKEFGLEQFYEIVRKGTD
jgi:hypothetical protein